MIAIPKPKKKGKKKVTLTKVQSAFNAAIRRRDQRCVTCDLTCSGKLEASHFYARGGSSCLRFYPPNVHCQCSKHHIDFHNRDSLTYTLWMQQNIDQLDWMMRNRSRPIKYSQCVLSEIFDMAQNDDLDGIRVLVESLHGL